MTEGDKVSSNHIDLTAAEIGFLWNTLQSHSLNYCLLKYFSTIIEDESIKELNDRNLNFCTDMRTNIENIFKQEGIPIPIGFSDDDLKETNEKLFTDPFILFYQWFISKGNLNFGSIAINTIARNDIFTLFNQHISNSLQLLNESRGLLLNKGLWVRAPYIPKPKQVEFIKKESFVHGWFGDTRPLTGIEIASAFYNLITNSIGLSIVDSFHQVTETKEIKNYFLKGKKIAIKHIETLDNILKADELPAPSNGNSGITSTTKSPFSEKLMLTAIALLNSQGLSNYGIAASTSARRDVGLTFTNLAAEVSKFAEEGMTLLIERGWMESPPHAPKRDL